MRSKVTNVNMNMKSKCEEYECGGCLFENESQKHVYECTEIFKRRNMTSKENPEYEKIMWGNLNQKINVARIFNENMKLLEKIRDEK